MERDRSYEDMAAFEQEVARAAGRSAIESETVNLSGEDYEPHAGSQEFGEIEGQIMLSVFRKDVR